jgi:hypothetical protein
LNVVKPLGLNTTILNASAASSVSLLTKRKDADGAVEADRDHNDITSEKKPRLSNENVAPQAEES